MREKKTMASQWLKQKQEEQGFLTDADFQASSVMEELTIDFGKNKMGLSDELITIGQKINELSKSNTVLLLDAFCDSADDVYQFKFLLIPVNGLPIDESNH
jgi:hypothetical protein